MQKAECRRARRQAQAPDEILAASLPDVEQREVLLVLDEQP